MSDASMTPKEQEQLVRDRQVYHSMAEMGYVTGNRDMMNYGLVLENSTPMSDAESKKIRDFWKGLFGRAKGLFTKALPFQLAQREESAQAVRSETISSEPDHSQQQEQEQTSTRFQDQEAARRQAIATGQAR